MADALIVHKDRLPQSQRMDRAAQYVRISIDYQRYSIENQAAVIAAYARAHGLTIVRTYRDEGESGLKIKNRKGLAQLMEDVQSGHADFDHILAFDVSRWGRFQDVDESAYYEYACKQAGINVAYCAEQFDNDGSLISNIVKNIKRVMAAEYSRELSAKVHAGASRLARLGFKMGGPVGYGLERMAVDEKSHEKGMPREQKFLSTDRVRVQLVGAGLAEVGGHDGCLVKATNSTEPLRCFAHHANDQIGLNLPPTAERAASRARILRAYTPIAFHACRSRERHHAISQA